MPGGYLVQCFNCLSDFDATEAIWCSCNPQRPTKVCPFCLGCFCAAGQEFKDSFWRSAPAALRDEVQTLSQSRMLIGEMLVRSGLITTTQLLEALTQQKSDGRRLGEILVDSGAMAPDRLERFLQSQHTVTAVDLSRARVDAMLLRRLGVDQCLRDRVLPLEPEAFRDRHIMTLAMADPSNTAAVERVMKATGYQVIPGVAPAEAIVAVIRSIFPQGSATPATAPQRPGGGPASAPGQLAARKVLALAVKRRASHVQIHSQGGLLRLFFRIDGTLYLDRSSAASQTAEVLASLKRMAGLEAEARTVPRVGRAPVPIDGLEYQLIVRARPGREGEEISVKILDPVSFPPRLEDLSLPPSVVERVQAALDGNAGLLVVSAPAFSGASSTLYALVMEMASQGRALAVVESPRAVSLADVIQEEFFPEIRNSLSDAIERAVAAGAQALAITACDGVSWTPRMAALPEGMLVICKVEALTLPDALLRLAAGGYPAACLASRPTLVLHQRLVRRICASCRTEVPGTQETAAVLGLTAAEVRDLKLWRGTGCNDCGPTPGFRGRVPLAQSLRPDGPVVEAVAGGSPRALADACRAAGLTSLRREALAALAAGLTTPEEISRKQLR